MRPVYIAGTGLWPDAGPSAAAEAVAGAAEPRPPCELVPSRAKRGTSLLTQMMVEVATRTARAAGFDLGTAATVFGSSHGEMEIAVDQMVMMKDGKGLLSPARFKNSVHNTGAGLFTIGAGNQGFTTAIAAGQDTAAMALLEGWLLLDRGEADEVIVTVADEALPEPLRAFAPHAPLAVGVALCTAPPSPDAPPGTEAPPLSWMTSVTRTAATMPGTIVMKGTNILGNEPMIGVLRAAEIELLAIARWTSTKFVVQ